MGKIKEIVWEYKTMKTSREGTFNSVKGLKEIDFVKKYIEEEGFKGLFLDPEMPYKRILDTEGISGIALLADYDERGDDKTEVIAIITEASPEDVNGIPEWVYPPSTPSTYIPTVIKGYDWGEGVSGIEISLVSPEGLDGAPDN